MGKNQVVDRPLGEIELELVKIGKGLMWFMA